MPKILIVGLCVVLPYPADKIHRYNKLLSAKLERMCFPEVPHNVKCSYYHPESNTPTIKRHTMYIKFYTLLDEVEHLGGGSDFLFATSDSPVFLARLSK